MSNSSQVDLAHEPHQIVATPDVTWSAGHAVEFNPADAYDNGFHDDEPLVSSGWGNFDQSWSTLPWGARWERLPYEDDDLGVRDTIGSWGPASPVNLHGWGEQVSQSVEVIESQDVDGQQAAVGPAVLAPAALKTGALARLHDKVLEDVFMMVGTLNKYYIPLNDCWTSGRGRQAINDIIALMQTSGWLYNAVMGTRRLWGTLTCAAHTRRAFGTVMGRAANAPLRLAYRDGLPVSLIESHLHRAQAVYLGGESPWHTVADAFGSTSHTMPVLKIMFIKPNTRGKPAGSIPSATAVQYTPQLRVFESSYPVIVEAPLLERVGLANHNETQIIAVLERQRTLERIDISDVVIGPPIDLTALIAHTGMEGGTGQEPCTQCLEFLRIRCGPSRSAALNQTLPRLDTPVLETLDVGGPIWISAPGVIFVRVYNTHAQELLDMLKGMLSVERLHVRWRAPVEDLVGPDGVVLPALREICIAGKMSEETELLLWRISAPAIRMLHMYCDMLAPPKHDSLPVIRAEILAAVNEYGNDAEELRASLSEAQSRLWIAGYDELGDELNTGVLPALEGGWQDAAPVDAEVLRSLAASVVNNILAKEHAPAIPHAGFLLRRVVRGALALADLTPDHDAGIVLKIYEDSEALHVEARARADTYIMRFTMAISDYEHQRRIDSAAWGLARMLFGLTPVRPTHLYVSGDPIRVLEQRQGAGDVRMLREVLRQYSTVVDLDIDFSRAYTGTRLLDLLCDPTVLPRLERVKIITPKFHTPYDSVWDALADMAFDRNAAGHRLHYLALEGMLCVGKKYAARIDASVVVFTHSKAVCGDHTGVACPVCQWRT